MSERIQTHRELRVYQNAFGVACSVYDLSKQFPTDERYSLTDQIRRSSRSVCANIAEAWRKRRYEAAFIAKLNDAESEAAETQVWIEFIEQHGYLDKNICDALSKSCDEVIGQLVTMIQNPDKWILRKTRGDKR